MRTVKQLKNLYKKRKALFFAKNAEANSHPTGVTGAMYQEELNQIGEMHNDARELLQLAMACEWKRTMSHIWECAYWLTLTANTENDGVFTLALDRYNEAVEDYYITNSRKGYRIRYGVMDSGPEVRAAEYPYFFPMLLGGRPRAAKEYMKTHTIPMKEIRGCQDTECEWIQQLLEGVTAPSQIRRILREHLILTVEPLNRR